MSQNPLQKYFRQPKLTVSLPSKGRFAPPDVITGDPNNLSVFAMTGMDEIVLKTPDSLFTGESTVNVIQSCCPAIQDAWQVSAIDLDHLLMSIRIATYGNLMTVEHTCGNCSTENEYDIDLRPLIDHFDRAEYFNTIEVNDLTIKIRPLCYKEMTEINLENFKIQKKLVAAAQNFDEPENQKIVNDCYRQLADLQNQMFLKSIESVTAPDSVVTDQKFIEEWVKNSESNLFDGIRKLIEDNKKTWKIPTVKVQCSNCGTPAELEINMDQANFFVRKS
jgi:hypothetical protein